MIILSNNTKLLLSRQGLFSFSSCGRYTRNWKGAQPWQLTQTDQQVNRYPLTSSSVYILGEKRRKRGTYRVMTFVFSLLLFKFSPQFQQGRNKQVAGTPCWDCILVFKKFVFTALKHISLLLLQNIALLCVCFSLDLLHFVIYS